jgi:hypothetical protein
MRQDEIGFAHANDLPFCNEYRSVVHALDRAHVFAPRRSAGHGLNELSYISEEHREERALDRMI